MKKRTDFATNFRGGSVMRVVVEECKIVDSWLSANTLENGVKKQKKKSFFNSFFNKQKNEGCSDAFQNIKSIQDFAIALEKRFMSESVDGVTLNIQNFSDLFFIFPEEVNADFISFVEKNKNEIDQTSKARIYLIYQIDTEPPMMCRTIFDGNNRDFKEIEVVMVDDDVLAEICSEEIFDALMNGTGIDYLRNVSPVEMDKMICNIDEE